MAEGRLRENFEGQTGLFPDSFKQALNVKTQADKFSLTQFHSRPGAALLGKNTLVNTNKTNKIK